MTSGSDIAQYHATLDEADVMLAAELQRVIEAELPQAEGKVWHGHPVWFIEGNPVVGYHRLKGGMRVLFWSGQSFPTPGLTANGSFQAADFMPTSADAVKDFPFVQWLAEARTVQWDYKNLPKNRALVKLTDF